VCIGGSCFLFLTFYWEAYPLQTMVKTKQSEVDAEAIAIEAADKNADDIMMKICNDIYGEVVRGQ
jgi:hypothetical protein